MLLTALALGALGSLHCVGMCGPIALALPAVGNTGSSRYKGILLYNLGRVVTYSSLGILFGLLGKTFIIAGYQQGLSIGLGVLILLVVIGSFNGTQGGRLTAFLFKPVVKLKSALGKLFGRKTYGSLFSIGMLNGLLPCGMVYTAVAGAIAVADPGRSSLFMALFGLGTIPAMLTLSLAGQKVSMGLRNNFKRVSTVFVTAMAVLLIMRGMNLGIPYLSPELSKHDCTIHHCCKK